MTPDATSAQGLIQTSNGAFDRLATMLADLILRIRAAKQTVRAACGESVLDLDGLPLPAPQASAGPAVYRQAPSSMCPDQAGCASHLRVRVDTCQVPQGSKAEGSSGRWVVLRCASTYCLPWQCLVSSCRQPQQHRMASCRWPSCAWCPSFMPWLVSLAVMHVGFCSVQNLINHSSPDTGKCMAVTGCRGLSWPARPFVCALSPDAESAAPPCKMGTRTVAQGPAAVNALACLINLYV